MREFLCQADLLARVFDDAMFRSVSPRMLLRALRKRVAEAWSVNKKRGAPAGNKSLGRVWTSNGDSRPARYAITPR